MSTAIEKFLLVGTQEAYDNLETPNDNMLYFCSDTKNIYKGSVLYTDAIRKVTVRPTIPAVGKLYHITSTNTVEFHDGTDWNTLINLNIEDILLKNINSSLDTDNKTIIGAINELKAEIEGLTDIGEVEF